MSEDPTTTAAAKYEATIRPYVHALESRVEHLRREVERLRVTRDHQRVEIEWLHDRLRQIVLVAQRAERGRP